MSRHQYERKFYFCNCIFDPILSDAFDVDVGELVLRDISTHPFFIFLLFCFLKYIWFFSFYETDTIANLLSLYIFVVCSVVIIDLTNVNPAFSF